MPMVNKRNLVFYPCPNCGSENVTADANAEWCSETQTWQLAAVFDSMYCHDCEYDSNTGFKAMPLPNSEPDTGPEYKDGVMVPQPVDKAVAEPVNEPATTKLAIPQSSFIKLIRDGQIVDTSEFEGELRIPD